MDEWTTKTRNPICRLFFEIDLLTDFAALCLTDLKTGDTFTHGLYFRPSFELLHPWTKELYLCTVAPLPSLWAHPPPPPKLNVQYIQTVCGCGGGVSCVVDHILQEFYTLFLTRFRTYKIASPPQTKMTKRRPLGIGVFKVPSSMALIIFFLTTVLTWGTASWPVCLEELEYGPVFDLVEVLQLVEDVLRAVVDVYLHPKEG